MNVKDIVSQMSLEEKASMVTGADFWRLQSVKRLGIETTMVSDGPHGLRKQSDSADNLGVNDSIKAVCFPTGAGSACSFNRELLYSIGRALGAECQAEGVSILLGPAVNIKRSPLCGRNFEYFSEDPYLAGELAASYIMGVQSQGVGTSIKHFAVNNQEKRRCTVSAVLDERTLREIYLAAFERAVKKSKPWTVMCSYNKINGVYSSENDYLLNKVLRDEWGFEGYVMSDWGAVNNRVAGLPAGLDLEMPSSGRYNASKLIRAVESGQLVESVLDTACERIVEGIFRYMENQDKTVVFDREADHQKARVAACESMVLLKNNGVLPLESSSKIAFIGEFAEKPRYQGGGSSHINSHKVTGALEAVTEITEVAYAKGFYADRDEYDQQLAEEAIRAAGAADAAVVFAGLPDFMESEGFDRTHLNLPQCQNKIISEICAVQPNTVVVLHNGSPVLMPWLDQAAAVLEAYLGGQACGEAQIDLLYGRVNPSGKLAETFPLALEDTPAYGNYPGNPLTVEYREGIFIGYRYYDKAQKEVLFPFGFGLSYTKFEYSNLTISKSRLTKAEEVTVAFKIKNIGDRDGAEAAQLYIAPPEYRAFKAPRELKGFEKVFLKVGEEKEVTLTLDWRAFAFYNVRTKDWDAENGQYALEVGASSRDIRLREILEVESPEDSLPVYEKAKYASYYSGSIEAVPDQEFERLLGFEIPPGHYPEHRRFTLNDTLESAQNTKWGKRIKKLLALSMRKNDYGMGNSEMMIAFAMEAPLQMLVAMGQLTEEMGEAIVMLWNNEAPWKAFWKLVKGGVSLLKR